jgi:hypothetical protein
MIDLLFLLILGHLLGDFAFQSDRMAKSKSISKATLTLHSIIYTIFIAIFLFFGQFLCDNVTFFRLITPIILILLFVEHWIQDYLKATKYNNSRQGFYLDQSLHLIILFGLRIFIYNG